VRRLLTAGLLVFGTSHFAFGALGYELEITDGTNTALINSSGTLVPTGLVSGLGCGGSATASGGASGVFVFVGCVGNYSVNITTGLGGPAAVAPAILSVNSTDSAFGTSGPLKIEWSENGITTTTSPYLMSFTGTFTSGGGSTISNTAYEDNGNGFFAQTQTIGTLTPTLGALGTFTATGSGSAPGETGPYSLTEVISVTGVGPTQLNGAQATLDPAPVPEPASVVLLGSVISATVIVLRRRRAMKKALID
jgi:hypothetical protein